MIYGHAKILQSVNEKYPFTRTEVKLLSLQRGQHNFSWDNCFNGIRPLRCVVGFVKSQAVAGDYSLCPWNFKHYDLRRINLLLDGIPSTNSPLLTRYDSQYGNVNTSAFLSLCEKTGKYNHDSGNGITSDDISQGVALYAFMIEPYFDFIFLPLLKSGNIRIDCDFDKPLPEPVTCVLYAEIPAYFEINQARDVVVT